MSKVIAIDGPSGSGKSTIAKKVANLLNLTYLDTGAMFRALGYSIKKENILFSETEKINAFLETVKFEYGVNEKILIRINDEDLTHKIREHEVSKLASEVSQVTVVRDYLKNAQRKIGQEKASILEGRDIGTVIFPDAHLKFFLTADPKIRAQRRYEQLVEKDAANAEKYSVEGILKDIEDRDTKDKERAVAPLVKAEDAFEIDTSHKTIEEIISIISEKYESKKELFH